MTISDSYDKLNFVNGSTIIVTGDSDINTVLSGTFGLNGLKTPNATTSEEALGIFEEYLDRVDSLLV
ncbi:MAG: hypothetical protein M3162_07295, partial [Thermoproteota archaeon]|nr:hypothetical protein [Thermoproteota archaeon]